jgi:tetratricopeptide (TPR) repeat protein
LSVVLLASCSSTKNTGGTRWYHSFNTRYNVYFNGNEAYKAAWQTQLEGYSENYSKMILMYPVSALPKDKQTTGGSFDKSIEKAVKAIKMHSIQTRPQKKAGKQNDPKYQEFMSRTEYNPFLHNAWMMMAKSQFHNGDFLQAAGSFSYISRLYESQPEIAVSAKIWKARCYSELGWYYEADDILSKLNNDQMPKEINDWFSTVYADYLIKRKQYTDAIPYMKIAIKSEKNKRQRTREKYLLGQMYMLGGQKDMAYKLFGEVSSSNAPYILELSAKIRQTEVFPGGNTGKMTKQLKKMAGSSKNKEYLDQIYYALGNVYMTIPDTVKAIQSYELGVEKSKQNGLDKALNQICLGDIYFTQREYVKAQPNYSEALSQLNKEDEAYPRVSKRSEVLDELVIHYEAVELQDSLQRLSRMTEEERLVVVQKIIDDLIKKEEEELEKANRDEYLAQQDDMRAQQQNTRPNQPVGVQPSPGDANSFYFYSQQVVALGKNAFQQKWGRRKLEDDWRRRNKSNPLSDLAEGGEETENAQNVSADNPLNDPEAGEVEAQNPTSDAVSSSDPKDPQFYLQQIPVTEEDIEASNLIIIDGLFNMSVIYKDLLEDNNLALETFELLNSRFPDNENKLMTYYHSYLIFWRDNNMEMANAYKNKIRSEFPESDLAIAMADPDYEYNRKMTQVMQDSLYHQTYDAYLDGKPLDVRKYYEEVSAKYNQSKLMPKFMFLNALSYVQTNDADLFKFSLKELIEKYPTEDVALLAGEMMKGFQRGLLLSSSGDNMLARGSLFNMRFGAIGDDFVVDSALVFSDEKNTPHEVLLIYPKGSIDDNLLLFAVASFNFGNFMVNDFDLEKTEIGEIGILQIKGFNNLDEGVQYVRMINRADDLIKELGQAALIVPVSTDNYATLMKGKSLGEYMAFFEEHFADGNENLIAAWRLKQAEEIENPPGEEENSLKEMEIQDSKATNDSLPKEEPVVSNPEILVPEVIPVNPPDSVQAVVPVENKVDRTDVAIDELYDKASEKAEGVTNALNEIMSDPIRGIQKLFGKKKSVNAIDEYAKQQEKEEKERRKQLMQEKAEKEKADRELAKQQEKERKALLKQQDDENRALLKAQKKQEEDLAKMKAAEKKQQEADKKQLAKEKDDVRKLKKAEQKEREKQRNLDLKQKAKERKEAKKIKDAEQKAKIKARQEDKKRKETERKTGKK